MKKQLLILIMILIGISSTSAHAMTTSKKKLRYPIGCEPVGYSFNYYTLTLKPTAKFHRQSLFFIHNTSSNQVKLRQVKTGNEPYIVHNNTKINGKQWSAYATNEKKSEFICTRQLRNKKNPMIIDCAKVLDLCEYPRTRFGTNHTGNYWAILNKGTHTALRNAMRRHGVLLVDPKKKDYKQGDKK